MADLWIYDTIGAGFFSEGVTAKQVRDDLAKIKSSERVTVHINSPGGDVFEAIAISSLLSAHRGGVDVQIDGVAASAASFIATLGETVTMAEGSMLMIHDPWTVAVGNRNDMMRAAELLDKVTVSIQDSYARKSGKDADEVRAAMLAETWYTVDEAIEFGLADAKAASPAKAWAVPAVFGYKHCPKVDSAAPEPVDLSAASIAAMRRRLDLARAS